MYIIVRVKDNVIVGSANNPVDNKEASKQGRRIYEIDNADFDSSMIGQKLTEFEVIE